ncbi:MAG: hypothetical protein V4614_02280 [Pseudomonadota bacterium]
MSKKDLRVEPHAQNTPPLGADGVTPARFLGWEFRNGRTIYTVTEDGLLEVRQGKRVLVSEQGQWDGR